MLENQVFHHSQRKSCRNPSGAVCAGTRVKISIEVAEESGAQSVILRLWQDSVGETLLTMSKSGFAAPQRLKYTATVEMPEAGSLVWYYFILSTKEQTYFYGNNPEMLGGQGKLYEKEPPAFQITVHNRDAKTPDWFKHAVMYQIFPDRFYRSGFPPAVKSGAVIHAGWNNAPCYFKDPDTKEIVAYDFFGGNLLGILEKLPYLKELGIGVLYLNPVFESTSNHRYDTGDYHKIDPILGDNETFSKLCQEAEKCGIRIVLDGVFSHTGSDSKYFNREGNYDSVGAYQSMKSPYYEWYDFKRYPFEYESWWGFNNLPNVKETTPSYIDFIIDQEDSVLKYWMKQGIKGWRLDVIDELPPAFSQHFYKTLKETDPEAVLIGEVWEDASNKISYGVSRAYLSGDEMDSAMNYPLREIWLDYFLGREDAAQTNRRVLSLRENYPAQHFYAMMNLVGSHDVERVLTLLGEAPFYEGMSAISQSRYRLPNEQYQLAVARLKMLSLLQMTFPGVPCVYYGDEIGMQGFRDPHNRGAFAWGEEDTYLQSWYKKIIALRNANPALRTGEFIPVAAHGDIYGYVRRVLGGKDVFGASAQDQTFLVVCNRSHVEKRQVTLDLRGICSGALQDVWERSKKISVRSGRVTFVLNPLQAVVYRKIEEIKLGRGAGILLHPTSLPSKYGIGDFGRSAYEFINFLVKARQRIWQILPLNPVGYGGSPYQALSAFAGNPMLLSPGKLVAEGLLSVQEANAGGALSERRVDFERVWASKEKLLRSAYRKFAGRPTRAAYREFCQQQKKWLDDYALFMALKKHFKNTAWNEWEPAVAKREESALEKYRKLLADEIDYQKFLQYQFFQQWTALRRYANHRGVRIVGDMPIFLAYDSADVWAQQELFQLNAAGRPEKVAGVPPDYFSATGQLWGNPHYRWEQMRLDDYQWWRDRFASMLELVDIIRVDHFRGFEAYWEVPGDAETAISGRWVKGPGAHFFSTLEKYFGKLPVIAEDLGVITDEVNDLKDEFSFPGMKVLQFELLPNEEGAVGFICEQNCIVYTGTHDNNTTVGWLQEDLNDAQLEAVGAFLNVDNIDTVEACWELIRFAYASNASAAIIPMQDLLALDVEARMNLPGTVGGNWRWRAPKDAFTDELAKQLASLCAQYGR